MTREALLGAPPPSLPSPPQPPPQWESLELQSQVEFLRGTLSSLEASLSGYETELGAARREAAECLALSGTATSAANHCQELGVKILALTKELEEVKGEKAALQALALVGGGREAALQSALTQCKDQLGRERGTLEEVSRTLLSLQAANQAQEQSLLLLRGGGGAV
jgi:hypothetical protein